MKVAKQFRWEGAHRLPWHTGGCQNLHGHSYCMWVELKGDDQKGMLIDFKDIKKMLSPLLEAWDHATLVSKDDSVLLDAMHLLNSKHYLFPYDTTSENICIYVTEYMAEHSLEILKEHAVYSIKVKVQETETCFAEYEVMVDRLQVSAKGKLAKVGAFS
jgi:6-pyruvoyltetrahydropterin/6-carboxytetrahydropterin synthase